MRVVSRGYYGLSESDSIPSIRKEINDPFCDSWIRAGCPFLPHRTKRELFPMRRCILSGEPIHGGNDEFLQEMGRAWILEWVDT